MARYRQFKGREKNKVRKGRVFLQVERLETRDLLSGGLSGISRPMTDRYVDHLYDDVLQREADAGGFAGWKDAVNQGISRPQAALGFQQGLEFQTKLVGSLYHWYLGRAADSNGLDSWVKGLQGGGTVEQVKAGILGSQEYFDKNGSTNDTFLAALYQDALGRPIDPDGQKSFGQELANNVSRATVAQEVLSSDEGFRYVVGGWYQQYLRRPADEPGLSAQVSAMHHGVRDEQVLAGIVGSDEYYLRLTEQHADVVVTWTQNLLNAVRTDRTPPPIASRAMGMMEIAIYDAVHTVDQTHQVYNPNNAIANLPTTALPGTSREAAVAEAAYTILVNLYPSQKATFDSELASSLGDLPNGVAKSDGISLGTAVANAILPWRASDGSTNTVTYTPGTAAPDWQPTPGPTPATNCKPALLPQWPGVTPFALTSGSQFRPSAPPLPGSTEFNTALAEVQSLGQDSSTVRTADQTQIAYFWADNPDGQTATPPGHWMEIAEQMAMAHTDTLAEDARLFGLLGMGLADAGIAAWDAKYAKLLPSPADYAGYYRPITAINNLENQDCSTIVYANLAWRPLLATPNFPTYVSGHSTFSASGASILTFFFGDNISFTTTSDFLPGVTRSYASFEQAAEEAGQSRIYGGIHFQFDNTGGRDTGMAVGNYVVQNYLLAS